MGSPSRLAKSVRTQQPDSTRVRKQRAHPKIFTPVPSNRHIVGLATSTMRSATRFALILSLVGFAARAEAQSLTMQPPHRRIPVQARLHADVLHALDAAPHFATPDQAIDWALAFVHPRLHFGLSHTTNMSFENGDREAHCEEYAQFFARVLTYIARVQSLSIRVVVYRSTTSAGWLGRAFRHHDWVLVSRANWHRIVDPTFSDMLLGSHVDVLNPPTT